MNEAEQLTLDERRPASVEVTSVEFFDWCARAERGECRIGSMQYGKVKLWKLALIWPQ